MKNFRHAIFHTIFWGWNLAFLGIICGGFWPTIAPEVAKNLLRDPFTQMGVFTLLGAVAIAALCAVVGWRKFRTQPLQLIRLFFGVEVPLLLFCLLRLFMVGRFNSASTLFISTAVVGIVAFYLELLYGYAKKNLAIASLQVIAHTFLIGLSLQIALVTLSYSLPLTPGLLIGFFSFVWVGPFLGFLSSLDWKDWWQPAGSMLLGFSALLFFCFPFVLGSAYIRSGHRVLKAFAAQYGQTRTLPVAIAGFTAWMVLFISLQQQPQSQAFQLLAQPLQTERDRQMLLDKTEVIRAGLLNAYLADYRYLGTSEGYNYYTGLFAFSESTGQFLQETQKRLLAPFLYQGSYGDRDKAKKLYAQFFDTPIEKGEAKTIQAVLKLTESPWWRSPEADLLAIDQQKVRLRSQQVTVSEQGDWADVELYEAYQNQTPQQQEIRYAFTLPETAVLTGLWLGNSANREQRFEFQVSPRGGAEKVYTEEVRRRVDPALLEQVGPQQYRLRVFPIPPELSPGEALDGPTEMHLWLTYKVMRQAQGWALPQLTEKRNIFWDRQTRRLYNNQQPLVSVDNWLPTFLPASSQTPLSSHQAQLTEGYRVSARPITLKDYTALHHKRFAVVVDSSYSMSVHAKELTQAIEWLKQHGFADRDLDNNDADIYVTTTAGANPQRIDDLQQFDSRKMTFYGSVQPTDMLCQFLRLRAETAYDGILVLTDSGSYELGKNQQKAIAGLSAPVWMVHLGGLPIAYEDAILKIMETSGGGAVSDLPTALRQQATQAALGSQGVTIADGYAWFVEQPVAQSKKSLKADKQQPISEPTISQDSFAPLAARQLILSLSRGKETLQPSQLDTLHAIAKTFKIVSPYSSMIVLVNEQQQEALKRAERQSDRFERAGDQEGADDMVGAPEPGVVIGLVAIACFLLTRPQRHRLTQRRRV